MCKSLISIMFIGCYCLYMLFLRKENHSLCYTTLLSEMIRFSGILWNLGFFGKKPIFAIFDL